MLQLDSVHCSRWMARRFQSIAMRVLAEEPRVRPQVGYWPQREVYPVSVFLSLGYWDPDRDEIAVVSFQIWQGDGLCRRSCDVVVDNYRIAAEMSVVEFLGGSEDDEFPEWLGRVAEEAATWVDSQVTNIVAIVKEHSHVHDEEGLLWPHSAISK